MDQWNGINVLIEMNFEPVWISLFFIYNERGEIPVHIWISSEPSWISKVCLI